MGADGGRNTHMEISSISISDQRADPVDCPPPSVPAEAVTGVASLHKQAKH